MGGRDADIDDGNLETAGRSLQRKRLLVPKHCSLTIMMFFTFLPDLVIDKNPFLYFSLNIFQLALHVSALWPWSHAVAYCTKQNSARPNFTFTHKSESEIWDKRTKEGKKVEPPRGDSDPSQHIPLLHRPRGPSLPS